MAPGPTYAIGDLHGRLDLLDAALEAIRRHRAGRGGRLVLLGDYIDRGPQSRGVVERLMALSADPAVVCLKGNHEVLMIEACRSGAAADLDRWFCNGGFETLVSYGWDGASEPDLDIVPPDHLAWMDALPFIEREGARVYVHAGVEPEAPAGGESEQTCLWIRERFLRAKALPLHVVHGHTPLWAGKPDPGAPERLAHRTNLDTAAYHTGVLAVGVFEPEAPGGPAEILWVGERRPGTAILPPRRPTWRDRLGAAAMTPQRRR